MRDLAGKTAFVTGGAGGIGLALARAFAQAGMKVMLADIEPDALQAAVKSLQEISPDIRGTLCDVTDAASVERANRFQGAPSEMVAGGEDITSRTGCLRSAPLDISWSASRSVTIPTSFVPSQIRTAPVR